MLHLLFSFCIKLRVKRSLGKKYSADDNFCYSYIDVISRRTDNNGLVQEWHVKVLIILAYSIVKANMDNVMKNAVYAICEQQKYSSAPLLFTA